MWNAWTAPPGALPRDYDPWACEAHCARCGELAQDCHCEDDDMSEQQQRDVRAAAAALVAKLDAVHSSPSWQGAMVTAHLHGHRYNGPTYSEELEALRRMLETEEEPTS